jgi:putative aldouronate transport system permease protein
MTVMNLSKLRLDNAAQTQPRYAKESPAVHVVLAALCLMCLLPLLLVVSISLSDEVLLAKHGFRLIPMQFSLEAYTMIFEFPGQVLSAYSVTIFTTVTGTLLSLVITSMAAYSLSRPWFAYRKFFSFYIFFTMLFSGGLVPYYILVKMFLHLDNTIWIMIVPFLFGGYNAFLMRTNFQTIPISLSESAKIDGASEFRTYWQLILPLSTPTIATVGLFTALSIWNDWFQCLLFIDKMKLWSLQFLLQQMMANLNVAQSAMQNDIAQSLISTRTVPTETLRMAMCIIAIGPIVVLFPFLQKYFVRGLTVGSVKG